MEKIQLDPTPDKLFFSYEISNTNYFFSLNWDGNVLVAKQFSKHTSKDVNVKIIPDYDEWEEFLDELSAIDAWSWYELYEVKCVDSCVEGDEWELYIEFDEEKIESYGSNSYPPTFREFIKAVEQLTGLLIEFIHEE